MCIRPLREWLGLASMLSHWQVHKAELPVCMLLHGRMHCVGLPASMLS